MSIAGIVTRGYGSFGTVPAVVLRGYASGVTPPVPPPPTPAGTGPGGFDAGGFGKWFNLANSGHRGDTRRPGRRESEIARMLDALVYREEDEAALAALPADDADEVAEIVHEAVREIEAKGATARDDREAMALIAAHVDAYRAVVNVAKAEAWRMFLAALVDTARRQWTADRAARIAQDDADLLILVEFL